MFKEDDFVMYYEGYSCYPGTIIDILRPGRYVIYLENGKMVEAGEDAIEYYGK